VPGSFAITAANTGAHPTSRPYDPCLGAAGPGGPTVQRLETSGRYTLTVNYVERMTKDHRQVVSFGQGFAVVVDGSWIEEDGGLKLLLEQYEMTGETHEPVCRSEQEVKDALLKLGAYEDQAAASAGVIWANRQEL
jgi:hypothetical protein